MRKINFMANFLWALGVVFFIPLLSGMLFSNSIIVEFISNIFCNYDLFFKVTIITALSYLFLLLSLILKLRLIKRNYFNGTKPSIKIFRRLCLILTGIVILLSFPSLLFINVDFASFPK